MIFLKKTTLFFSIHIFAIGCFASPNPSGNPLDPNNIEGLLLALELGQNRISQLTWTSFDHGLQINSVTKNGNTIYALVNISNTGTPNYQLHSSTDGITFNPMGVPFANGNTSINRISYFENKLVVHSSTTMSSSIFTSSDLGATWNSIAIPNFTPSPTESFTCLLGNTNPTDLFAIFETNYYTSIDGGAIFNTSGLHTGILPRRQSYCSRENGIYYMVGGTRTSNSVNVSDILVSSTPAPSTWTNANNGVLGIGPYSSQDCGTSYGGGGPSNLAFTTLSPSDWVAVGNSNVSRTKDSGSTWECQYSRTNDNSSVSTGQGLLVNIGNRVIGYSNPMSSSSSKGYYLDL
jgi:hypothetical protein